MQSLRLLASSLLLSLYLCLSSVHSANFEWTLQTQYAAWSAASPSAHCLPPSSAPFPPPLTPLALSLVTGPPA